MTTTGTALAQARLRLKAFGACQLTDAEILAVLIGSGIKSRDALDLAVSLLGASGGLHRLGEKSRSIRVRGLGDARLARLEAALELGRRCLEGPRDRRRVFSNPGDAARLIRARLANLGHEVFSCLFLDTRHRMIAYEPLFRGTIDGAAVYPREIVKQALDCHAAAVILAHYVPRNIMGVMWRAWLCGVFRQSVDQARATALRGHITRRGLGEAQSPSDPRWVIASSPASMP
jgi:DNA repair protein RadC